MDERVREERLPAGVVISNFKMSQNLCRCPAILSVGMVVVVAGPLRRRVELLVRRE